ncbi:hypothetical protein [Thalassotalea sp. ND16A]|uniref:hypothetical protein n=1 Tax=Thalassotalea sp. ND16A TaxID=1535422 RepID=UPI000519FB0F|nr:hypothetical protein [Thalassotalea sp. ND16A]KGJ92416.1 hypothetical protein ND16A_1594 [Thalassotalea sp. ND16A]
MNNFKKLTLPLALLTALVSQNAIAMDYNQLHQQLDIMTDIIKSSIKKQSDRKGPQLTRMESNYLASQGVVFTLNVSRSSNYGFDFTMPVMPTVPVAPRAPTAPEGVDSADLFGENYEIVIEAAMEEAAIAMELASEHMRSNSEEQREIREQERELAYELRDIAREERDLKYQEYSLEKEDQAEHKQEKAKLEQKKAKIVKAKAEISKRAEQYQKQVKQAQAEKAKQQQKFYQQLENTVSQVLCNYGGGLKALPDDEYVSMIIKGAGSKEGNRIKDKVLVFNKLDVKNCVLERIDANTLLSKANGYQF